MIGVIVAHTIFVDAVASLVIGLHKEFQLLGTFRMCISCSRKTSVNLA